MSSHYGTLPLKAFVRAVRHRAETISGTQITDTAKRCSRRENGLNLIASFLFDVPFSEGGRIEENVQRDFCLSAKMVLLRDALGRTNLKPGRFHDGVFSSVSAGTIFTTVLP
jgi:hypothetical protein